MQRATLETFGIFATTIGGGVTASGVTDSFGRFTVPPVVVDGVYGDVRIIGTYPDVTIPFETDEGDPLVTATLPLASNAFVVNVEPVIVTVSMTDPADNVSVIDPNFMPGVQLVSGIDTTNLEVRLNDNLISRLKPGDLVLPAGFPNFARTSFNGAVVSSQLGFIMPEGFRPADIQFVYYPTSGELTGLNTVTVVGLEDDVGHVAVDEDPPLPDPGDPPGTIVNEFAYP